MDEVLEERELAHGEAEGVQLHDLAAREFSVASDPGFRFSKTPTPNEIDLIPKALHGKGGGAVGRFHRLEAVDPVRTETLCYLATRDTLKWLKDHYPPGQVAQMQASDQHKPRQRARYIERQFERTTAERERQCLLNRHPGRQQQIEGLIETISRDEIEAFRRVLGLDLFSFPNRS